MKSSASTIPVKVKHVRECAKVNLQARLERIYDELAVRAEQHIKRTNAENRCIFRRLGWSKKLDVPTVEQLVSKWKEEYANGTLPHMTEQWWAYSRTDSDWWRRIETLSTLPESKDEEVMNLSIDDVRIIGFNGFIHAVSKAINP
jgi:hypothetical protein